MESAEARKVAGLGDVLVFSPALGVTILIEFAVNLYAFPLAVEVIGIGMALAFTMMQVVVASDPSAATLTSDAFSSRRAYETMKIADGTFFWFLSWIFRGHRGVASFGRRFFPSTANGAFFTLETYCPYSM